MIQTLNCTVCGGEFDVDAPVAPCCGQCECDKRKQERREAWGRLHPMFKCASSQWIRLNRHGLERLSELYTKGAAQAPVARTPDEDEFFIRFCEVWDYREYCNRRSINLYSWWFRLRLRIKFWLLSKLE